MIHQEQSSTSNQPTMDSSAKLSNNFERTLRSRAARRSLSGAPLTYLFETKFKHFKALQNTQRETSGLNFLLAPPSAAIYRSSMPVTPIATPNIPSHGLRFTEQALQNRILASQSSLRRARNPLSPPSVTPDITEESESQTPVKSEIKGRQDSAINRIDPRFIISKGESSASQFKDQAPVVPTYTNKVAAKNNLTRREQIHQPSKPPKSNVKKSKK